MRNIVLVLSMVLTLSKVLVDDYQILIDSSLVALVQVSLIKAEAYLKRAMRLESANTNNYILLSSLLITQ